jgi:hypothetical protein
MGRVIGFDNFANSIRSFLKNQATAPRTWTFPDKDGIVALDSDWVSWGSSLAPTGFSAFSTQDSYYLDDGKRIHIWAIIAGTSNATTFTFQLPVAPNAAYIAGGIILPMTVFNSGTPAVGRCDLGGGSTTVNVYLSITGTAFTNSGAKQVRFFTSYMK